MTQSLAGEGKGEGGVLPALHSFAIHYNAVSD